MSNPADVRRLTVMRVLSGHFKAKLTMERIDKIVAELNEEMANGPDAWAFKGLEKNEIN